MLSSNKVGTTAPQQQNAQRISIGGDPTTNGSMPSAHDAAFVEKGPGWRPFPSAKPLQIRGLILVLGLFFPSFTSQHRVT